jgi:hypothetical protein
MERKQLIPRKADTGHFLNRTGNTGAGPLAQGMTPTGDCGRVCIFRFPASKSILQVFIRSLVWITKSVQYKMHGKQILYKNSKKEVLHHKNGVKKDHILPCALYWLFCNITANSAMRQGLLYESVLIIF